MYDMAHLLLLMLALLSCIAAVSSGLPSDVAAQLWSHSKDVKPSESYVVPTSDIRDHSRKIWIITTACLPWMTGTSINPLLRAAYLAKDRPEGMINLLVPWLDSHDQQVAYPSNLHFKTPHDQREYIRNWLIVDANLPRAAQKLNIVFYSAKFVESYHSVFPMGDISTLIPDEDADVCVLEEPEHLNWFTAPFTSKKWMDKFKHVIGIIHTNYVMYARTESSNLLKELWICYYNKAVVRAYCHKVIKLSGALQVFAPEKEIIANVHGVREKYLLIGDAVSMKRLTKGAYFVGKLANAKGLFELFHLLDYVKSRTGQHIPVDVYGSGPHEKGIKRAATKRKLSVNFLGTIDHALLTDYKVFVNPSLSEVLCTTIVEALAMGKWVVCAKHPSNQFFEQFPNCLTFKSDEEFAANIFWALSNDPRPLTSEQRYALSWEAAMERFENAALITMDQRPHLQALDRYLASAIEMFRGGKHGDFLRSLGGAGGASKQTEYVAKYGSSEPIILDLEAVSDTAEQGDKVGST